MYTIHWKVSAALYFTEAPSQRLGPFVFTASRSTQNLNLTTGMSSDLAQLQTDLGQALQKWERKKFINHFDLFSEVSKIAGGFSVISVGCQELEIQWSSMTQVVTMTLQLPLHLGSAGLSGLTGTLRIHVPVSQWSTCYRSLEWLLLGLECFKISDLQRPELAIQDLKGQFPDLSENDLQLEWIFPRMDLNSVSPIILQDLSTTGIVQTVVTSKT